MESTGSASGVSAERLKAPVSRAVWPVEGSLIVIVPEPEGCSSLLSVPFHSMALEAVKLHPHTLSGESGPSNTAELGASDVTVGAPATHPAPGFGHGIGLALRSELASGSEWVRGVAGTLWFVRKFYLARFRRSASFPTSKFRDSACRLRPLTRPSICPWRSRKFQWR